MWLMQIIPARDAIIEKYTCRDEMRPGRVGLRADESIMKIHLVLLLPIAYVSVSYYTFILFTSQIPMYSVRYEVPCDSSGTLMDSVVNKRRLIRAEDRGKRTSR